MPLVPYHKLVKVRITSEPCPICKKRVLMQNTTLVDKDGKKVRVCSIHVPKEEEIIP